MRYSLLCICAVLFPLSPVLAASPQDVVEIYLKEQVAPEEGAEPQGFVLADLDGDGKEEIVLVWTTMGPTYWHNNLVVLAQSAKGYEAKGAALLEGEAETPRVKGNIIIVPQTLYAKNDPICCPTIKKDMRYRWSNEQIVETK